MQRGIEDYKDKEICILGGGDGALLYELLKEQPKHVVMLEIDEMVVEACAKHLESISGDVLTVRKAHNYEVNILLWWLRLISIYPFKTIFFLFRGFSNK